jgi:hypothetical protein
MTLAIAFLIAFVLVSFFVPIFGILPAPYRVPIAVVSWVALLLAMFVAGIAYRVNWHCPSCQAYLGQGAFFPGWDITHCRYCGVRLQ